MSKLLDALKENKNKIMFWGGLTLSTAALTAFLNNVVLANEQKGRNYIMPVYISGEEHLSKEVLVDSNYKITIIHPGDSVTFDVKTKYPGPEIIFGSKDENTEFREMIKDGTLTASETYKLGFEIGFGIYKYYIKAGGESTAGNFYVLPREGQFPELNARTSEKLYKNLEDSVRSQELLYGFISQLSDVIDKVEGMDTESFENLKTLYEEQRKSLDNLLDGVNELKRNTIPPEQFEKYVNSYNKLEANVHLAIDKMIEIAEIVNKGDRSAEEQKIMLDQTIAGMGAIADKLQKYQEQNLEYFFKITSVLPRLLEDKELNETTVKLASRVMEEILRSQKQYTEFADTMSEHYLKSGKTIEQLALQGELTQEKLDRIEKFGDILGGIQTRFYEFTKTSQENFLDVTGTVEELAKQGKLTDERLDRIEKFGDILKGIQTRFYEFTKTSQENYLALTKSIEDMATRGELSDEKLDEILKRADQKRMLIDSYLSEWERDSEAILKEIQTSRQADKYEHEEIKGSLTKLVNRTIGLDNEIKELKTQFSEYKEEVGDLEKLGSQILGDMNQINSALLNLTESYRSLSERGQVTDQRVGRIQGQIEKLEESVSLFYKNILKEIQTGKSEHGEIKGSLTDISKKIDYLVREQEKLEKEKVPEKPKIEPGKEKGRLGAETNLYFRKGEETVSTSSYEQGTQKTGLGFEGLINYELGKFFVEGILHHSSLEGNYTYMNEETEGSFEGSSSDLGAMIGTKIGKIKASAGWGTSIKNTEVHYDVVKADEREDVSGFIVELAYNNEKFKFIANYENKSGTKVSDVEGTKPIKVTKFDVRVPVILGKITFTPFVGIEDIDEHVKSPRDRTYQTAGVQLAYKLTKKFGVIFEYKGLTKTGGLEGIEMSGSELSFGAKYNF